jgi:DNA-binding LacI/PurR family transcriptional regulator
MPVSAIADVARLAGVSKSTASRALSGSGYVSEATRTRVVEVAKELGFVPSTNASSLVTGKSRNIGVLIPFVNRWFFGEILDGIEGALIDADYDLTLYRLSADSERRKSVFDYFLVRKRVDAVIAVGIELSSQEVSMLHSLQKPIVGIGGRIEGISTLSIDDVAVARHATEHLISLGHRRIAHFGGSASIEMDFHVHTRRRQGYEEAMTAAGLAENIVFYPTDFNVHQGFDIALTVLANHYSRPTAIFAACDEIGIGVILAARQLGMTVPGDLSVIGIDDHELAGLFQLTTFRQSPALQGARSVEVLMSELASPAAGFIEEHREVEASLIVRASTAVLREAAS